GCEKQYKQEESELFTKLAQYFMDIASVVETAKTTEIAELIQSDLKHGLVDVKTTASAKGDRGALRANTWSEKVTRILNSLLQRYEKEGEALLADTEIWVCTACGFVFIGDEAPTLCPVCKVPSWKFEKIERRSAQ
ncbi:MAG TPA: rubredoxin, partial [Candidatus Dorea intestinavium]|nr:rubredoxin [Candidatus Dorea intestinavium]